MVEVAGDILGTHRGGRGSRRHPRYTRGGKGSRIHPRYTEEW